MGIKFYKGVKIMDHTTHHNQYFPINIKYHVCTFLDAMIHHPFIKTIDKVNYHNIAFL